MSASEHDTQEASEVLDARISGDESWGRMLDQGVEVKCVQVLHNWFTYSLHNYTVYTYTYPTPTYVHACNLNSTDTPEQGPRTFKYIQSICISLAGNLVQAIYN